MILRNHSILLEIPKHLSLFISLHIYPSFYSDSFYCIGLLFMLIDVWQEKQLKSNTIETKFYYTFQDTIFYSITGSGDADEFFYVDPFSGEVTVKELLYPGDTPQYTVSGTDIGHSSF